MPFKSKAQRRKFAELLVKGEISEETFEEWNRATGKAKLPEYAHPKSSKGKKKAKSTVKAKARRKSRPDQSELADAPSPTRSQPE